jgi:hypothetical protein
MRAKLVSFAALLWIGRQLSRLAQRIFRLRPAVVACLLLKTMLCSIRVFARSCDLRFLRRVLSHLGLAFARLDGLARRARGCFRFPFRVRHADKIVMRGRRATSRANPIRTLPSIRQPGLDEVSPGSWV